MYNNMFSYTDHSNLGTVKETVFTVITALPMLLQAMQMVMVMPLQSHGEWSRDICDDKEYSGDAPLITIARIGP